MNRKDIPPRSPRNEHGQSLVELAISLTVMLLLLSGAVTFGMGLFSYVAIRDAANEGALYGSIEPVLSSDTTFTQVNQAEICARVRAASNTPVNMNGFACSSDGNPDLTPNNIDVVVTNLACEGHNASNVPNAIRVTVDYGFPIMMPFVGAIVGGQSIHLRAAVTDTILTPHCP